MGKEGGWWNQSATTENQTISIIWVLKLLLGGDRSLCYRPEVFIRKSVDDDCQESYIRNKLIKS